MYSKETSTVQIMEEEQGPATNCVCVNIPKTGLDANRLVSTQISVLACARAAQHCPSHLFFCQIRFQALLKSVAKTQETSFLLCCVCRYWLTLCSVYKDQ